jgi:predicted ATPase
VNLLIGPNGAGKTTLLDVPQFIRAIAQRGPSDAVDTMGGVYGLRHLQAHADEPSSLAVTWGKHCWVIELPVDIHGIDYRIGERLSIGDVTVAERLKYVDSFIYHGKRESIGNGVVVRALGDFLARDHPNDRIGEFVQAVGAMHAYPAFTPALGQAQAVRQDPVLLRDGANLFCLLRDWQGQRKLQERFAFVVETCREAYPGAFDGLEFLSVGQNVVMGLLMPGIEPYIPMPAVANGIRLALLHLAAVAGTPAGGYVALDELENGQHPHAIKALVAGLRLWAERKKLTICLASQSPAVINCFREDQDLERIFVMEAGNSPQRLVDLKERDWLRSFTLGEMYEIERFGEPNATGKR